MMTDSRFRILDDNDENFLLDDVETTDEEKSTVACRGQIVWSSVPSSRGNHTWGHTVEVNNGSVVLAGIDDHLDNLEDSPLLINDSYRESADSDFHCHNFVTTNEDIHAWKKLCMAASLCFLFMIAELLGGYLAGSLAVMTDAAHLFSDFIGFLISLLAIWVSKKPPSKRMTFGYYRAEVIGALLSVLTIWLLAAIFSTLAINRLYNNDYQIDADAMILISSLGLIVNTVMGGILHGYCHSHSPNAAGGSHIHAPSANINVQAAAVHVLGDFLQSFGVLLAALIIKFYPDGKIADPVCTLIFSLIVICTTLRVGKDSIWYLIEGSPINNWKVAAELKKLPAVKHIHNLHIWSLAPGKNAIAVHLAVDQYCDRDLLLKKVNSMIQSQLSVISCTVQIEAYNFDMINMCQHCQNLQC